jgi:hypothetical protein
VASTDWLTSGQVKEATGIEITSKLVFVLSGPDLFFRVGPDHWVKAADEHRQESVESD